MVHHRQRLSLGLKAGDDLPAVHAGLDNLECNTATDRLLLLGHVHHAHAPFADLLQELVGADLHAGGFTNGGKGVGLLPIDDRPLQKIAGAEVVQDKLSYFAEQLSISLAGLLQENGTILWRLDLDCLLENGIQARRHVVHDQFL